jgi:hypothetical protein
MSERRHGGFTVPHMQNGSPPAAQVPSSGSTENVSPSHLHRFLETKEYRLYSGRGEKRALVRKSDIIVSVETYNMPSPSSAVIDDIQGMRASESTTPTSLAFFYCDFRDDKKQERRGLLSSLLVQLCDQSDSYCAILSDFYLAHDNGFKYASDSELVQCLKSMLSLPKQSTAYIVIDALDECSTSTGLPTSRDNVLELVGELVQLQAPNLRICVTSRPEADIKPVIGPLAFRSVSLHSESGQVQAIAEYVKFVVNNDTKMRTWRKADKERVIDVLIKKADGM